MTRAGTTSVPCRLTRLGVVMSADPGADFEAEGVLNPASGRSPDGRPAGVRRDGVVLAPDAGWERSYDHAGVEDPRTTWIESLGMHVMSYVAFGPLGPRPALSISKDLRSWRRLGPVHFEYQPELDADLNLFTNKDVVYFPEAVPGPDGRLAYAMLHRPTWDLGAILGGSEVFLPGGLSDPLPGIWISYAPAMRCERTCGRSPMSGRTDWSHCPSTTTRRSRSGPARRRCASRRGGCSFITASREPWPRDGGPQPHVRYSVGAMLLDPNDPGTVLARTPSPLLKPLALEEREGTAPNVVFPTAIEEIDGQRSVFYGMADSSIGVARLDRVEAP
jgi:hypothetical protein